MDRRDFIKTAGAAAIGGGILASCRQSDSTSEIAAGTGGMTYRTNPHSGDKLSLLGYGCMRWPTVTDREGKEAVDQEAVNRLVDYAIEHGVNYFDTAPVYCQGEAEKIMGEALSRHPRDKYFIATKMSNFSEAAWKFDRAKQMYEDSFRDLRVDYIDYMLMHSLGRSMQNLEDRFLNNGLLDFLLEERKAGRIRNLGFSYHGGKKVFDRLMEMHEEYHWDFVMIQMNYLDWQHSQRKGFGNANAEYLYTELEKRGIPVMVMEPLLGGRLAKLPEHITEQMQEREPERSAASWAFRFVGSKSNVLSCLSGMTYMEHLQDNLKSFSPLVPLTEEENAFLDKAAGLLMEYPTIPCTDCKYCMPCPYGIDIPAIFQHYNKCVNEGNIPQGEHDKEYRKARRRYLISYDRAVEKVRQADHCIGCGKCVEHCPQKIGIPGELRRIDLRINEMIG